MHVNYDLTVMQNDEEVLSDMGAHQHEGKGTHMTAPLSTADPVDVTITFRGYGVDEITGPTNEILTFLSILEDDYTDLNTIIDQLVELMDDLKEQMASLEERIAVIETALEIGDDAAPEPEPEPQTGIQGKAYTDTNNNNRYDAGEPLLSGVSVLSINLSDHSDVERDKTNSNGEYFIERDVGSYLVQIEFTNSFGYIDVRTGSVTTQNLGIPSGNTVPETPEPETPESTEPVFITTDKTAYTLGDTIRVSGFIDRSILDAQYIDERVGITITEYQYWSIHFRVDSDNDRYEYYIQCQRATEHTLDRYSDLELGTLYLFVDNHDRVIEQKRKCFDDDGNFNFGFEVTEYWPVGNYQISIDMYEQGAGFLHQADRTFSQQFTVG